ncbi:MAG: alkyl sulfatase BDS1-like metallo-beta-lactamase superfamily hydrolase [Halioglobus sp.]|jgi:alkyl sulfatase BDS1-like metallo-beta-lactamase superfamily hydrolase
MKITPILFFCLLLALTGCERSSYDSAADEQGHSAPTQATIEANRAVLDQLPFENKQDFEDAERGLVARMPILKVENARGEPIWNMSDYDFIQGEAPPSVNPSLWRQASLNNIHGLFKVADGLYQLRGFDLANISIIEGKSGWIVVDPGTATETAAAAWEFASKHLDNKPIVSIIFTHSHIDHFGGVLGLLRASGTDPADVRIIAPKGFMEEATSENVLASATMGRRSVYMYGKQLARSERGHVGSGLGKSPAYGSVSIAQPTELIDHTPQEKTIDGVRFTFQYTPESEAPAELMFYLPEHKALCGAEVVSRNMHNIYTLRGAKVRDALKWSNYIDEALTLFGEAEVYFGSHHWPMWDKERINTFLKQQRDTYKYIHDQTMRLAAQGHTPGEIAEEIEMPESLRSNFSNRGYYGTLRHNARAVYQGYFGWYDGNPANLNPLPQVQSAKRYVKLMGGREQVLAQAQLSFDAGEYRWVAELLNKLVFAEPENKEAKALLARNYDQLGYQAESGPWRDVYLTGAYELRHGVGSDSVVNAADALGLLKKTPLPQFFDAMAVMLNGPDADGTEMTINLVFSDINENYSLYIENAVLHHRSGLAQGDVSATITLTHELFLKMLTGQAGLKDTIMGDDLEIAGSRLDLLKFFSLIEFATGTFNIVTP